jgi:hypothetical protein
MGMSDLYPSLQPTNPPRIKHMEISSASDYYQYKAESDSRIKSMSDEILRLKNEIKDSNLAAVIDQQVGDPDVSNLIFNLIKSSATETDNGFLIGDRSLSDAIESIRNNEALKRFFTRVDIPTPEPKRVYKQWFE